MANILGIILMIYAISALVVYTRITQEPQYPWQSNHLLYFFMSFTPVFNTIFMLMIIYDYLKNKFI